MAEYEEYEYEDEEYDDEEYDEYEDDEYGDEYDDDYQEEQYPRRRYDEDFDAVSVEPQVKTAIGIDGFAVIFSFVILLVASFLLARYSLYEVYDESFMGLIPPKEKPNMNQSFTVIGFGCDESISDVYNYAVLDGGADKGLENGLILYMGNASIAKKEGDASGWGICFVVTDVKETRCRADIIKIQGSKKPELMSALRPADGNGTDATTGEWATLASPTALAENLNWIKADTSITEDMKKVKIAPWDKTSQWILVEEKSPMKRVAKKKN